MRTRGVKALEQAQADVLRVVKMNGPGAQASERPPPRRPAEQHKAENDTVLVPKIVPAKVETSAAQAADKDKSTDTKSEPAAVARQHGALVAPKPSADGGGSGGATAAAVTPGGAAAAPGNNQDGGAANAQAAAPAQAGAAPAGN